MKLHMDPDAKGAVQKQRRISLPLKDKFDEILNKWEQMDTIEDVGDEPTEWCSNLVLTAKKDGENTKRTRDMPSPPYKSWNLNRAKYFSHLDMNDGYTQLELTEESRGQQPSRDLKQGGS